MLPEFEYSFVPPSIGKIIAVGVNGKPCSLNVYRSKQAAKVAAQYTKSLVTKGER